MALASGQQRAGGAASITHTVTHAAQFWQADQPGAVPGARWYSRLRLRGLELLLTVRVIFCDKGTELAIGVAK